MLPDISLHADAVEGVLPQKREPHLHRLGLAILDLHQPPARDALKVFLAFLVHEIGSRHRPALDHLGQRHRSRRRQTEVVRGAHGEVGHELDAADGVGTELEVTGRHAVECPSTKRCQICGRHVARYTAGLVCFGRFRRDCDLSGLPFSSMRLRAETGYCRRPSLGRWIRD